VEHTDSVTDLLARSREGEANALDQLIPLVYDELRAIAHRQLQLERGAHTLSTTGLVHEAYVQLVSETGVDWQDRSHFYAICARAMRRIVVDYARMRLAGKRGGGVPHVTLTGEVAGAAGAPAEIVLAVDRAVERLASFAPRLAQIVECRSFAGMTDEETAEALGTSLRTVQREWMRARAWLRKELDEGHGGV